MNDDSADIRAIRRQPPRFRRVRVRDVEFVTPRLARVTVGGPELEGLTVAEPAASVRLLLPDPGEGLAIPTWAGNEFLRADGTRPTIRTFTPRRFDPGTRELDLEIVVHGEGAAADWVRSAAPGDEAAVSGTGRGYTIDPTAASYVLAGDETALSAIGQLIEHLAPGVAIRALVEIADPAARIDLPDHPGLTVEWPAERSRPGDALLAALADTPIDGKTRVWVAGEAGAMFRIRRHLFDERGLGRDTVTVRGYWKHGRRG